MTKRITTLVIPDGHDGPEIPKERFHALGNFIITKQPDNLVQIGDFQNIDSFSPFLKREPLIKEGKRFKDDLDSGREAYEAFYSKIQTYNKRRALGKRRKYMPRKLWFEANHEYRCRRYVQERPELAGFIPDKDLLGVAQDGWGVVPYKEYRYLQGVAFTHVPHYYATTPVSGKYACAKAAALCAGSVVFGHTHKLSTYQIAREAEENPKIITALNVGWFGDYEPDYTLGGTSHKEWWSGLVLLYHNSDKGDFDFETINMQELKKNYL